MHGRNPLALDLALLADLFIALGIGALIGLQREHAGGGNTLAGSRTLPLLALLGALNQAFFPSFLWLGFAAVLVLVAGAYFAKVKLYSDPGLTTAVATLLTFFFGAMVTLSPDARILGVVFGTLTTALLALKPALHAFARRLTTEEVRAMLTFLVIALVVLPLLPNEELDILLGLNPRFVWMMVVFVSGIDLAAYILFKAFGARGFLVAGAVGGLVSSTATTVSMSNKTRAVPDLQRFAALAIVLASAIMLVRVLLLVGVVNRRLVPLVLPAIAVMAIILGLGSWVLFRGSRQPAPDGPTVKNPFRLTPALVFGAFFAVILLGTEWSFEEFGALGVYGAALVSGIVDVDAMTISLAQLSHQGKLAASSAAAGILLVSASNFFFKVGIAFFLGTRRLARSAGIALGGAAAAGVAAALLHILG